MNITKNKLKEIIKEEILKEANTDKIKDQLYDALNRNVDAFNQLGFDQQGELINEIIKLFKEYRMI